MTKALKKGFTLVELIVVIAIIAILSTVSVVGYSAFIDNANQSKADQEMAQVEAVLRGSGMLGTFAEYTVEIDGDESITYRVDLSLVNNVITFTFDADVKAISDEDEQLLEMNVLLGLLLEKLDLEQFKGEVKLVKAGSGYVLERVVETKSATLVVTVLLP